MSEDGDHELLRSLPKQKLVELLLIQARNMFRVDGLYFLAIEEKFGAEKAIEIADAAGAALAETAVGGGLAEQGMLALTEQERLAHPGIEVVPGEGLSTLPGPQVGRRIDAGIMQGLLPQIPAEVVAPAVEAAAGIDGCFEDGAEAAIATSEDPFEEGELGFVPLEAQFLLA